METICYTLHPVKAEVNNGNLSQIETKALYY